MTNDKDHSDETSSEQHDEELAEQSDADEVSNRDDEQLAEQSDADDVDQTSSDETSDEDVDETSDSDDDADVDIWDSDDEDEDSETTADQDDSDSSGDDGDDQSEVVEAGDDGDDQSEVVEAGDDGGDVVPPEATEGGGPTNIEGMAAFFDVPDNLMVAAAHTRDSDYEQFDAYSPFPIHGMDEAMGIGRSWIPWVTFGAGMAGFLTANALQFGTMTFDWPMIIGGKPFASVPAFVPIMFELSVLFAGVTTAIVMLIAAGCFRKPLIIDEEITSDRFALWISADDERFNTDEVRDFMESLDPVEIRTITNEGA